MIEVFHLEDYANASMLGIFMQTLWIKINNAWNSATISMFLLQLFDPTNSIAHRGAKYDFYLLFISFFAQIIMVFHSMMKANLGYYKQFPHVP
jgi:hypothetical protein